MNGDDRTLDQAEADELDDRDMARRDLTTLHGDDPEPYDDGGWRMVRFQRDGAIITVPADFFPVDDDDQEAAERDRRRRGTRWWTA